MKKVDGMKNKTGLDVVHIVMILNLYIILLYITLLSGIYPLPAMHSLLVTSDVRNISTIYHAQSAGLPFNILSMYDLVLWNSFLIKK